MTRVLLTGGSGFIAAHILDILLERGHSVVTTVRSHAKADKIKEAHPKATKTQLDFAIVEDIAVEGAFDKAVVSNPPFEAVIHTASPFHFNAKDIQKELLDPAIIGTTGILKSVTQFAPTVKRVVITSSFASIVNPFKGTWPEHTYTEKDWSPLTHEQALENASFGYRASKTFAEKAAWEFIKTEKPSFSLATMCPPLVFGPIVHYLNDLKALNTSNSRVRDILAGDAKEEIPETGVYIWIDVRDLALGHVKAMESPEAANERFFVTNQTPFCNKDLVEIVRKHFPEYADKLPGPDVKGGRLPDAVFKVDTSNAEKIGMTYRNLEESIVDLVKSLKAAGA